MTPITIDMDIAKKFGFPEALVMANIRQELSVVNSERTLDGWVKFSISDLKFKCDGTLGESTIRAAIKALVTNKLLIKGRPKNSTDHIMDRTCWYTLPKRKK